MITKELQAKIDRSIRLLQSVQKGYNGEIEVAYSGGKDSDVILQLAKEAGIRYWAIYKNTTIDPPGTIAHVKRMGVEIRRPKRSFFQIIAQKGIPNRFNRFCCSELKEYKILDKCIIGVRKEESAKRNTLYNEPTACHWYGKKTEENHVEHIYPILDWTSEDVLVFIMDRKIQLAPIYYGSGGGKSIYRNALAAWDALWPRIVNVLLSSRKGHAWLNATFGLLNIFLMSILTQRPQNTTITLTNILQETYSILLKRIGKWLTTLCLESPTGRIFLSRCSA